VTFVNIANTYYINTDNIDYVKNGHETFTTIHVSGRCIEVTLTYDEICAQIENARFAEKQETAEVNYREKHKYG